MRRLDEGKALDIAQVQRLHPQDHAGQRAAQNLGVGERRAAGKIFRVIQPDADAVSHAAAAARALVGRCLADGLDQQLLHLAAKAVALDARRARIDHVTDTGHGQRGFRHVGGQHNAAAAVDVKDAILLGLRQTREQRQHLGVAVDRLMAQVPAQMVGSLTDLALAGQEDEDVAAGAAGVTPQFVDAVGDGAVQVVVARLFVGAVTLLDREHPARHIDDRCRPLRRREMFSESVRINRRRCHNDLEVRPARQDLAQVAEQKVDVQRALVRLVDDDGVVGFEQGIGLGLGQQDAVGHELDRSIAAEAVLKAHLEAHHFAQGRLQFLGNSLGHAGSSDSPRLRMPDHAAFAGRVIELAAPHGQCDFRQLRGLARPGLAADDDDLVRSHRGHDVFTFARDRQRFGEFDFQGGD